MHKIIEVQNLVKRYRKADTNAVDNISFDVGQGELFAFLGPNGAGKTTTISILTTTLAKTSGSVAINGFDLDRQAVDVRRSIGIIFQNPTIDLHLSAEENIRLHVALYGIYGYRPVYRMMPADYRRRVERLAQIVGIDKELFKPLRTYSGGMKRKLEIIRSLMHRPGILFLDEPTSGLDPVSRASLWSYLRAVRNEDGTTVFLTTHYLDEAEAADRVCVVDHGRIAMIGTPAHMKSQLLERSIVLDASDRDQLLAELGSLNLAPVLEASGLIRVPYEADTAQSVIARIKTPLSVLRVHEPSLEEAYVELVAGSKEEAA
jgi:ABC-2 type transport system ATP-binding protein